MAKLIAIDDSELVPKMLERILKRHGGHTVVSASDGEEGLRIVAEHPDAAIIFLDLSMPVMDGFEFLRRYRSDHPDSDIPVVIISARDSEDFEKAKALGAVETVAKPIQFKEIALTVAKLLHLKEEATKSS